MVKLKVINLRRVNHFFYKFIFFTIIFFGIIIPSIKKININDIKENFNFNVGKEKIFNFKNILGTEFIFFNNLNEEDNENLNQNITEKKLDFLKDNIELFGNIELDTVETVNNEEINIKEDFINSLELSEEEENFINSNFVYVEEVNEGNITEENITNNVVENIIQNVVENNIDTIPNKLETKIVAEKNKEDKFNTTFGSVKIRNESKYTLDQNVLNPDLKINNKTNVVIYHTHTCESYTPTEKYNYVQSGNYRSIDLRYSVSKVGDVLEEVLKQKNYNVIHAKDYHDYPAYNGSYNRALTTIKNTLNIMSSEIVIDLHRDALGNNSDYGPCIEINGEKVAQLMFVIGTDGGGLTHNNWRQNLKFAVGFQAKAEEMYPGLFKPMIVRNARYNQHVAPGAVIIEVGATGNTLEEAEGSMKYLAKVLDEYMKSN